MHIWPVYSGARQSEGHADMSQQPTPCAGVMALQNLPAEAMAEAAIAAALLLEHTPLGAGLLLRPGALTAFINAVLDENSSPLRQDGECPSKLQGVSLIGKPARIVERGKCLQLLGC